MICNSFLNMNVIVALIYKMLIVAQYRRKRKKNIMEHKGTYNNNKNTKCFTKCLLLLFN